MDRFLHFPFGAACRYRGIHILKGASNLAKSSVNIPLCFPFHRVGSSSALGCGHLIFPLKLLQNLLMILLLYKMSVFWYMSSDCCMNNIHFSWEYAPSSSRGPEGTQKSEFSLTIFHWHCCHGAKNLAALLIIRGGGVFKNSPPTFPSLHVVAFQFVQIIIAL